MQHLNAGCSDSVYFAPAVNPLTEGMPWSHLGLDKMENTTSKYKNDKAKFKNVPSSSPS